MRPLISFDWAIKRLLRQKSNFGILEGFLSVLLNEDIKIISIPESESNGDSADDKVNKVDILCETKDKKLILIELQYNSENDYFHRMLFGVSKIITNYMLQGYTYDQVKKVISINIVYFDLGQGKDYVYYGNTEFKGLHFKDTLEISNNQKDLFSIGQVKDIYPEYYIIKVNRFNDVSKNSLDEWIFYLKNNALPEHYSAKGLDLVYNKLKIDDMDNVSKIQYDAHQKELAITYGVIETAKYEGKVEGKAEGKAEGILENAIKTVVNAFKANLPLETISVITNLNSEEINDILRKKGLI